MFIRGLERGLLTDGNHQFPKPEPAEQPMEQSHLERCLIGYRALCELAPKRRAATATNRASQPINGKSSDPAVSTSSR
jgi:hypothetical protein